MSTPDSMDSRWLNEQAAFLTQRNVELSDTVARLTAEVEARTEERDAALTLAEPLDRLYEWAKRTIRADLHSPLEIMGEYESLREERDRMAAALVTLHELMVEITKDEIECAQSDDGFAVKGWIKVIRLKYQAVDALLENPSAILAAVKARAKAEGLREAAEKFSERAHTFPLGSSAGMNLLAAAVDLAAMAAQAEGEEHDD